MTFLGVPGVCDYVGLYRNSRWRSCSFCLPRITRTSASGLHLYGAEYPPRAAILCPRFVGSLTVATQDSRPSGSLSGRRRRAVALASVRRPNCPYTFRVGSFHEDVGFRDAIEGINQTRETSPYSP